MLELVFAPCAPLAGGKIDWLKKTDKDAAILPLLLLRISSRKLGQDPRTLKSQAASLGLRCSQAGFHPGIKALRLTLRNLKLSEVAVGSCSGEPILSDMLLQAICAAHRAVGEWRTQLIGSLFRGAICVYSVFSMSWLQVALIFPRVAICFSESR